MSETNSGSVVRTLVDILKPETCPKALAKFFSEADRAAIAKAVESGDVVREVRRVKVSAKKSGTGQAEYWDFAAYLAAKAPGMTTLARGLARVSKEKPKNYKDLSATLKAKADSDARDGACDYFNYGYILTITQPIRLMLETSLGGVDKAIAKQVVQAMKLGFFANEEAAREFVVAQREKLGLALPDVSDDDDDDEADSE